MRSPTITPAAPRESRFDHCDNGCVKETNETYACRANGCGKDHLCSDCTWSCDECSGEFCEDHSTQIEEDVFLCGPCLLKRNEALQILDLMRERARQILDLVREPVNVYEPHGSDCGVYMGQDCDCLMGRVA